jgi:hypothetical protein
LFIENHFFQTGSAPTGTTDRFKIEKFKNLANTGFKISGNHITNFENFFRNPANDKIGSVITGNCSNCISAFNTSAL